MMNNAFIRKAKSWKYDFQDFIFYLSQQTMCMKNKEIVFHAGQTFYIQN